MACRVKIVARRLLFYENVSVNKVFVYENDSINF